MPFAVRVLGYWLAGWFVRPSTWTWFRLRWMLGWITRTYPRYLRSRLRALPFEWRYMRCHRR